MNISVVGSGYVGTTLALCLADMGHEVVNIDVDSDVVTSLNAGRVHFHEDGLQDLLDRHVGSRFSATSRYGEVRSTDLTFLCLPTPSRDDGSIDTSIMQDGAKQLGGALKGKDSSHVVVIKSTVLPGTTEHIGEIIEEESGKRLGADFHVASNPEFLREGSAVKDFTEPDKVVIGGEKEARAMLREVYDELLETSELVETDVRTAEMVKYVNNALLATKISFANEVGNVCKELGIDTYEVMDAVALDDRIERSFLDAGAGFGGSCFPKDVSALLSQAKALGIPHRLLQAVLEVNEKQPLRIIDLLERKTGSLEGRRITVLGLSFKPGTDDTRESRTIPLLVNLLQKGASVTVHDPEAKTYELPERVKFEPDLDRALRGAEACVLMTDWPIYRELDLDIPTIEGRRMNKGDGICW